MHINHQPAYGKQQQTPFECAFLPIQLRTQMVQSILPSMHLRVRTPRLTGQASAFIKRGTNGQLASAAFACPGSLRRTTGYSTANHPRPTRDLRLTQRHSQVLLLASPAAMHGVAPRSKPAVATIARPKSTLDSSAPRC